jgi:hypothetical protein
MTVRTGPPAQHSGTPDTWAGRGALTGALISGIFGLAWAQWGASGLSGSTAVAVRVTAIIAGVLVIAGSARLRRTARPEPDLPPMFASRAYWVVVAVEVAALTGGALVLGATGHPGYVAAWFAAVVGAHFVAFGYFFTAVFYWLGAIIIAAAIAGTAVGLAGGGRAGIAATTGLITAATLLIAGARTVLAAGARPARGST